jgi:hypothetical protein
MITVEAGTHEPLIFKAVVQGLAIYLDNFAIKELAKGDPSRRRRFVGAFYRGADLLFSVTNAAELCGPTGKSFDQIKAFLNELGAHWFPVELNTIEVVKRESEGAIPSACCLSRDFMKDYFKILLGDSASQKVIGLSEEFFRLGAVMDWVAPQRDSINRGKAELDAALTYRLKMQRAKYEQNPEWLDQQYPVLAFNPARRATFAYVSLSRTLMLEAKSHQLKRGDGTDFCHTIMASAYASLGTLDKHWKRRVDNFPKPNQLAHIYYAPEIDKMVDDIEAYLSELERQRNSAVAGTAHPAI